LLPLEKWTQDEELRELPDRQRYRNTYTHCRLDHQVAADSRIRCRILSAENPPKNTDIRII